jgi:triosephosphate isomerase
MRTPIVVGNWKLNKTVAEALALVTELKNQLGTQRDLEVGVAPVFTALHPVAKRLEGSNVLVFGQDCCVEDRGAYTGEVAASLLRDAGCHGVIVGHSERRALYGETSELVGRKARAGLDAGLITIVCLGETERERDAGKTEAVVAEQFAGGFAGITPADLPKVVIAYEPVWAIGTGKTATPAQAQEVHAQLRALLGGRFGAAGAATVRIQYGGSVKPDNAAELCGQGDIDGALVGGASLKAEDFTAIAKSARLASTKKLG